MPEIPLYQNREEIPELRMPKADPSIAGKSDRAMANTVGEVGAVAVDMGKKISDMNSVKQYGNLSVGVQKQLMDLHDGVTRSPEFVTDPEAAEKQFLDGAEKIQQGFQGQITNPKMASQLQIDFSHHVLSYTNSLRNSVVRQQGFNAHADLLGNEKTLKDIALSGDEFAYSQANEKFSNLVAGYVATGAVRADTGKEMVLKFKRDLDVGLVERVLQSQGPEAAAQAAGSLPLLEEDRTRLMRHIQPLMDAQLSRRIAVEPFNGVASESPGVRLESPGGTTKNNLGNIRSGPDSFRKYETPEDGVADAAALLRRGYRDKNLLQIANKWAPASDGNNPAHWANVVSKVSGLPVGEKPNLDDPDTVSRLLKGIATIEKEDPARFTPPIISRGVERALGETGSGTRAAPGAKPPPAPIDYESMENRVKAQAAQVRPGDAVFQDHAVSQFRQEFSARKTAERLHVEANRDILTRAVVDPKGPKNMEELLTDPGRAKAYSELFNTEPASIQPIVHALEGKANKKDPETSARTYYELLGLADRDPEAFTSRNLLEDYPNLEDPKWHELVVLQQNRKAGKKDVQIETMRQAINGEIAAFFPEKKAPKGGSALDEWNVSKANAFTSIEEAVKKELEMSGKKFIPPERVREIARGHMVNGVVSGTGFMGFGVKKGKGFENMDNPAFIPDQTQVPGRFRKAIEDVTKSSGGKSKAEARFDPQTRRWYLVVDGQRFDYKGE